MPTARRKADEIIRLKEEGVRPSEIASRLGIGRASVYRVLARPSIPTIAPIGLAMIQMASVYGEQERQIYS